MAITLVGTPQGGFAIDAGDVMLTFDVAPQENDVVLVFGGPAIVGASAIVTSGYTALTADGLNSQSRSWYKVMGAVPDIAVVCDGGADARDAVAYVAYVLRGVDVANVADATAVRTDGTGSSPDPGAITTVTGGAWVFAFASLAGLDATPGALSGYTGQVIGGPGNDTFDTVVTGMYKEVASAGPEDPPAYTGWSGTWAANTVALRPAVGGGSVIPTPIGLNIVIMPGVPG